MNRDEYVEVIKQAAMTTGSTLVMSYILARQPLLATPVVKEITKWIVEKILGIAIFHTEMGAFFLFTDFRTSAQGRAFFQSALKRQAALKNGNEEEIKRAEADMIDNFRSLVKFTT